MQVQTNLGQGSSDSSATGIRDVIKLDDLNAEDHVLIRTRNSSYSLRMLDPAKRHGILTGGGVIRGEREVVLFESVEDEAPDAASAMGQLRRGARGLFYLAAADGLLDRLLTSTITNLILWRAGEHLPVFD